MPKVKFIILDIDGSLTDGKIYMGNDGESMKAFSIKDGYAVNFILKPNGIEPIVITGRKSHIVENRCKEIGIERIYQGKIQKYPVLIDAVNAENLGICAYFGDDVLDLDCMTSIKESGGVVGCPSDAVMEVKSLADYICVNRAGYGAFREFSEWLVKEKPNAVENKRRVAMAIEYIRGLDKSRIYSGMYEVNEYFHFFVQEYDTIQIEVEECRLESHRKYIDIQWIVEGEEIIVFSDISRLNSQTKYDDRNDIIRWKARQGMTQVILKKDSYIIFYPNDAHTGGINTTGKHHLKKIIGKVKIVVS